MTRPLSRDAKASANRPSRASSKPSSLWLVTRSLWNWATEGLPSASRRRLGVVELADGGLQIVALDEAHGVEGPAVGVAAQAVDRHDAGVLQATGDLRFQQEADRK